MRTPDEFIPPPRRQKKLRPAPKAVEGDGDIDDNGVLSNEDGAKFTGCHKTEKATKREKQEAAERQAARRRRADRAKKLFSGEMVMEPEMETEILGKVSLAILDGKAMEDACEENEISPSEFELLVASKPSRQAAYLRVLAMTNLRGASKSRQIIESMLEDGGYSRTTASMNRVIIDGIDKNTKMAERLLKQANELQPPKKQEARITGLTGRGAPVYSQKEDREYDLNKKRRKPPPA